MIERSRTLLRRLVLPGALLLAGLTGGCVAYSPYGYPYGYGGYPGYYGYSAPAVVAPAPVVAVGIGGGFGGYGYHGGYRRW